MKKQGAEMLRFSAHTERRARERGVSVSEVIQAVLDPDVRHPGQPTHGSERLVYRHGDLAVVTGKMSLAGVVDVLSVMWRWEGGDAA
jgi:hypothetical protein